LGISEPASQDFESLASYRRCQERIRNAWPDFREKRKERLQPHPLLRGAPEEVAESILEDLFTGVLDWALADFQNQVAHADLVLTDHGVKKLVVEVKRPHSLAWNKRAVDEALDQAKRYADEQKVKCAAVSDGEMLYAEDRTDGGWQAKVFVSLSEEEPQSDLWGLSVQAIWRMRPNRKGAELRLISEAPVTSATETGARTGEGLIHPKYKIPASCFAYVGDFSEPHSWKLPYLLADGTVDTKRLPKAIGSILSNYRGAQVSGIPEAAIPEVLSRLARAACNAGHMPSVANSTAPIYRNLADALDQLGLPLPNVSKPENTP